LLIYHAKTNKSGHDLVVANEEEIVIIMVPGYSALFAVANRVGEQCAGRKSETRVECERTNCSQARAKASWFTNGLDTKTALSDLELSELNDLPVVRASIGKVIQEEHGFAKDFRRQ
jgi:hypothetical protein